MDEESDRKYASFIMTSALGVRKDDWVVVSAPVETRSFIGLLVAAAYEAGAAKVIVDWSDEALERLALEHESCASLAHVFQGDVDKRHEWLARKALHLAVTSPWISSFADCDAEKKEARDRAKRMAFQEYYASLMANEAPWCVIAYPNPAWAARVFPTLAPERALPRLHDALLDAARIHQDPARDWQEHVSRLKRRAARLNDLGLVSLYFKAENGTDITIPLAEGACFKGGAEETVDGRTFLANVPTEEVFSMPHRLGATGTVIATRPLLLSGVLVKNFRFTFRDGKVTSFTAEEGEEALSELLSLDEGASRLGEVALIAENTPIAQSGLLYESTLLDENASCHLALGAAYSMNMTDAFRLSPLERRERGMNSSLDHVDFMFGCADMRVTGTDKNGKVITLMENGEFLGDLA